MKGEVEEELELRVLVRDKSAIVVVTDNVDSMAERAKSSSASIQVCGIVPCGWWEEVERKDRANTEFSNYRLGPGVR